MHENQENVNRTAMLGNVVALGELVDRVINRSQGLPGMAAFYGRSGVGKSVAAAKAANMYRAYYVEIKSAWSRKRFCQAVLQEMGIRPSGTVADMLDQICEQLTLSKRPLLIDESDYLVKKGMIEIVRDIYEGSQGTVILIGEEGLPRALAVWERIHNRMLDWVKAEPCSLADCKILAPMYAKGVEIAEELLARVHKDVKGCTRRVCVNFDRMREYAALNGLSSLNLENYKVSIDTGNPVRGLV